MEKQQGINLIEDVFDSKFSEDNFRKFAIQLFNEFNTNKVTSLQAGNYVYEPYRNHIKSFRRIGQYLAPNGDLLDVLTVKVKSKHKLERARTALRNFAIEYLKRKNDSRDSVLMAFFSDDSPNWRLSFIKLEYKTDKDKKGKIKVKQEVTSARRYSFLVGEDEPSHTAKKQLLPILIDSDNNPTLEDIEKTFNIEKVTKEFFEQYKILFLRLNDKLEELIKKDSVIKTEFKEKEIAITGFSKKLLGQIVFLYFIQKKGWLGVPKDKSFGQGDKRFLKSLYEDAIKKKKNYFNDYLESLFYEALAVQRTSVDPSYYKRFDCRIPFLNGGLFEPIKDYDWKNTEIIIPNKLFSNTEITKENDVGTGILDVFDRFNFTVKEDEPLEKEVAVDPEMLGKVFENLLEVKDRKSTGAYYTPREIVHYMCQESLINYLDTTMNSNQVYQEIGNDQIDFFGNKARKGQLDIVAENASISIPQKDIKSFIKHNHLVVTDNRQDKSKKTYQLPDSVKKHAEKLDFALANIKVCDPAIGSGAFPVGMLNEIVRARIGLTQYLNISENNETRTPYHLKRDCIQNSLYGVDIDASAIDIAKLRLWLSLVVDEESIQDIEPLPNLDYKIVCGNSLLGIEIDLFNQKYFQELEEKKEVYFSTTDPKEKRKLHNEIEALIMKITNGKKDFDFNVYFSEVWHYKNGFDVVIGNPPYGAKLGKNLINKLDIEFVSYKSKVKNSAIYFIYLFNKLSTKNSSLAYIIPKSICFSSGWNKCALFLLSGLQKLIDTGKAFEKVKLEQIVFIYSALKKKDVYLNGLFENNIINEFDLIQKKIFNNYNILISGQYPNEIKMINRIINRYDKRLGEYVNITRGLNWQSKVIKNKGDIPIYRGAQLNKFHLSEPTDFISLTNFNSREYNYQFQPKILNQLAIAHVKNPSPHFYIQAVLDYDNKLCFETISLTTIKNDKINLKFIFALNNSSLFEWIVYKLIYSNAIRSTRYDEEYIRKVPVPDLEKTNQSKFCLLIDEVLKITNDLSRNNYKFIQLRSEIDARIAHIYDLTQDEYKMVLDGSEDTFRITALNFFRDLQKGILK